MAAPAWTVAEDGLRLTIRLTPRGGRDGLDGLDTLADGRQVLKVRVRAAPSDGEANAALMRFLADLLDLPRSRISLVAGASARLKTVVVSGDGAALLIRLQARLGPT
ncbi:DUF167 family protein [Bosea sp. PAMC 26642]|uniref:DUF167 family protein n=1 Tax=Bosea sp. (strain PAMC 26642) TaxID=1792307 RepID=UPI00077043CC|nr:DUF167 family protein [Bosea sp. PAMC 26642]AMJ61638.1 hypothetical protein AXW83_16155 [Bosea sp. PAMC 26642]